jgi:hypothetical protein
MPAAKQIGALMPGKKRFKSIIKSPRLVNFRFAFSINLTGKILPKNDLERKLTSESPDILPI